jgi:tRNA pseudouridine55 synthase
MNGTPHTSPTGLLIIDKPEGITSMGVCRKVRGKLVAGGAPKRVKVGHGGTLDPLATGVLVVLVGKATRLCDRIMAGEKRYLAGIDLSQSSTTDDREGERTPVRVEAPPTLESVAAACARFVGTIMQRPPAYSAIKVDGERAYRLARGGQPPTLPARPVVVHSIDLVAYDWPVATLDVRCGKGTYIRSLARDLGEALTGAGMLLSLRRTAVGEFGIDRAKPLADLPAVLGEADLLPIPGQPGAPRPQ